MFYLHTLGALSVSCAAFSAKEELKDFRRSKVTFMFENMDPDKVDKGINF